MNRQLKKVGRRIAFVFTTMPHGSASGREGLDAALATSALSDDIALFFIADGVFQLLARQQPEKILARNYIVTFGVLPLYDVDDCFICIDSLKARGIKASVELVQEVKRLNAEQIRQRLATYDVVLSF